MEPIYSNFRMTFLYIDRYQFSERWFFPESEVPYCMYRYIVQGKAVFTVNGQRHEVQAGDVFYIPSGSLLSCQALETIDFYSVRFVVPIEQQGGNLLNELFRIPPISVLPESPEQLFATLYRSALSREPWKMLRIDACLGQITALLAEHAAGSQPDHVPPVPQDATRVSNLRLRARKSQIKQDPRITVVLDYLITHPQEMLSTDDMCRMAGVSESTLRRLFKAQTGKLPVDFIKEMRMMHAARLLLTRNDLVAEISYSCGYETPNYFSRCFKEIFGISPSEYRHRSQNL